MVDIHYSVVTHHLQVLGFTTMCVTSLVIAYRFSLEFCTFFFSFFENVRPCAGVLKMLSWQVTSCSGLGTWEFCYMTYILFLLRIMYI